MMTTIIEMLWKLASTEAVKELIVKGLQRLVASTDNGIDDKLLEFMLDEAVQSKLNSLTKEDADGIKVKLGIK